MNDIFSLMLIYVGVGVIVVSTNESRGFSGNIKLGLLWPLHIIKLIKEKTLKR